ncbi:MAG: 4'-phosphopantetheinyl transferase superfamily protein [Bacteroidales bacterium]|nr:4'-phosphopantetheinyl transferase superfamily protein [Bacteroidales bacterium]
MNILFEKKKNDCKVIVAEISENSPDLFQKIKKELSNNELNVYNKFTNERRKKEWLGVRLLLLRLLGFYSEIKYSKTGNPYIEHDINISITHSKNILGIILSKNKDIGMDVEILSDKILRTAQKFITKEELLSFSEDDRLKKIYLNWCCKETLFKIKEHGGFDFKTNFKIIDSELQKSGQQKAIISFNNKIEHFNLNYEFIKHKNTELLVVWH